MRRVILTENICETDEAATEGNPQCGVCTIVTEIYGTTESVAPWLCTCEQIAAANLDDQRTSVVRMKQRITSIHYKYS